MQRPNPGIIITKVICRYLIESNIVPPNFSLVMASVTFVPVVKTLIFQLQCSLNTREMLFCVPQVLKE